MSTNEKLSIRLAPEVRERLDHCYKLDGSPDRRTFIERSIQFYLDYLELSGESSFLPKEISSAIEGQLGQAVDRLGRLLFKQAVEISLLGRLAAMNYELSSEELRDLRDRCVRDVRKSNGQISVGRMLTDQEDDPWQG